MDAFREKLEEIKRLVDEDVYRKRVLLLCQQSEPKSFDEYSSSGSFKRIEKFESSTYSEVLKAIDMADNNKPVVMKIMRALSRGVIKRMPSITTKGCQSYNDILNELVVTQALSQLHDGVILNGQPNALYRTHFFCHIHEIKVVSGNLNRQLQESRKRSDHKGVLKNSDGQTSDSRLGTGTTDTAPTESEHASNVPSTTLSSTFMSTSRTSNLTSDSHGGRMLTLSSSSASVPNGSERAQAQAPDRLNSTGTDSTSRDTNQAAATNTEEDTKFKVKSEQKVESQPVMKDDDMSNLAEDERMLMESLPHEYVVSVMRHDGQPLWWMMTHKKLTPGQLTSVLVQVIVGLAIAENVYLYEHRDLHVSNILIKRTANEHIPFILDGQRYNIVSQGIKATIIDATFSRLTHNGKVYYRDLTSTLRAYNTKKTPPKMSLQNRSYRQMVRLTKNKWEEFAPKTNLIWLTYLCETLMKNEVMKSDQFLINEIRKIRDYTLKVKTTFDLLACFPFERTTKSLA